MSVYYAMTDENGVLCVAVVEDVIDEYTVDRAVALAQAYPDAIYFAWPEPEWLASTVEFRQDPVDPSTFRRYIDGVRR